MSAKLVDATEADAQAVYRRRFGDDADFRKRMWQVLCRHYFQQFIPVNATVLEVAAGYCEFINHIDAGRKIAVDINEETRIRANPDVHVHITPATNLSIIADETVDVVFVSNFLEHITKPEITKTLQECYRVLKQGGHCLVLQPNIRFVYRDYWMFYDHVTPLDDRALREVLEVTGFMVILCRPRFLPYTTKSRFPRSSFLIWLYLKLPILHALFGGQAFVVAEKRAAR